MKKKKKNKSLQNSNAKITPAAVIGMFMGLSLTGFGLYEAVGNGRVGAYYIVGLGVVFCGIVGSFYVKR